MGGWEERFLRLWLDCEGGRVGWLVAVPLHGAAPSRGWLPGGGDSLQRLCNLIDMVFGRIASVLIFDLRSVTHTLLHIFDRIGYNDRFVFRTNML